VVTALAIYSAVTTVVWSAFLVKLIPLLTARLHLFTGAAAAIGSQFMDRRLPPAHELRTFFISLFLLLIWVMMVWNLVRSVIGLIRIWLKSKLQRNVLKAAAGVAEQDVPQ
jgi:hypothetical protein